MRLLNWLQWVYKPDYEITSFNYKICDYKITRLRDFIYKNCDF